MKYHLCKELREPLMPSSSVVQIQSLPADMLEEAFLRDILQLFMSDTMDPDIRGRKPDKFLLNLKTGKLGDYDKRYIRIAVENKMPVGLIIALPKGQDSIHILSLSVHPAYRQKGIGKSLILKCEEDFSLSSLTLRLIIDVHSDNTPALKLYTKLGYSSTENTC